MTAHDLGAIARWLARQGYAVYPQIPYGNTPVGNCSTCKEPGHAQDGCTCLAAVNPCHALHAASANEQLTASRWEHAPRCNPALHVGRSELVVIDVDTHDTIVPATLAPGLPAETGIVNGLDSYAALLDRHGLTWPTDTLMVRTPTGGLHVYYQAPRVPLRHAEAAWQVEIKAGTTSITAPGSVRTLDDGTTGVYERISDTSKPAPFPRWLGEWLVSIGRVPDPRRRTPAVPAPKWANQQGSEHGHSRRWWERAWSDQLAEIAQAAPGTRNWTVCSRGLRLFNLLAEPGCPWSADDAETALVQAQEAYAANTGRPMSRTEYVNVARATRARATSNRGGSLAHA